MWRAAALMLLVTVECTGAFAAGQQPSALVDARVQSRTFRSALLGKDVRYGVYLPPSYDSSPNRRYPVLYFLHGLQEDETRWSTRGRTDQILDRMIAQGTVGEFIVALPFGETSFYTNTRDGREKWEDVIVSEFVPTIEKTYRVTGSRTARGISGISMGGYGALKIAMKHPEVFGSASAHSPVLIRDLASARVRGNQPERMKFLTALFQRIYAIDQDLSYWDANNPLTLAEDTSAWNGLKIYFDCGTEDEFGFAAGARELDEMLGRASYPHEAHLFPGVHGWTYASQHTEASMAFHWRTFSAN